MVKHVNHDDAKEITSQAQTQCNPALDLIVPYLGKDPVSIVAKYIPIHMPCNTQVLISFIPFVFFNRKDFNCLFEPGFFVGVIFHLFKNDISRKGVRLTRDGVIMDFEKARFTFHSDLKDVTARLCEITHCSIQCKVTFNGFTYTIMPSFVHPPVPRSIEEFKKSTHTTAILVNWLVRLHIIRPGNYPRTQYELLQQYEFLDVKCREICDFEKDAIIRHIESILHLQGKTILNCMLQKSNHKLRDFLPQDVINLAGLARF